jgi:hypothetical protein
MVWVLQEHTRKTKRRMHHRRGRRERNQMRVCKTDATRSALDVTKFLLIVDPPKCATRLVLAPLAITNLSNPWKDPSKLENPWAFVWPIVRLSIGLTVFFKSALVSICITVNCYDYFVCYTTQSWYIKGAVSCERTRNFFSPLLLRACEEWYIH